MTAIEKNIAELLAAGYAVVFERLGTEFVQAFAVNDEKTLPVCRAGDTIAQAVSQLARDLRGPHGA
jgi:hypothetical protein